MAIFSDAEQATPPVAVPANNGWDNITSIKERRKENTVEARPWTGETLKAGKKAAGALKMEVFKDPVSHSHEGTCTSIPYIYWHRTN